MLKMNMFGKIGLALLVGLMLLQAPFAASAARCCSNADPHQASIADGCCAAMGCCVISSDPADNQLTPAPVVNELSTLSAPVGLVSLIDFPTSPNQARFAKAPLVAHSPPPLALLCTRLI